MPATSRHLKVRIDEPLFAGLERMARRRNTSLSDLVRGLIAAQVQAEEQGVPSPESLHAAVLACLLATELAVQLLIRVVPGGEREALAAVDRAADQARNRLDQVEMFLAAGERGWRS